MVFQGKISDLANGPVETAVVEWLSGTPRAFRFAIGTQGVILGSAPGCDIRLGASNPPLLAFLQFVQGTLFVRSLSPLAPLKLPPKADPFNPETSRPMEGEAFLSQGDTFVLLDQKALVLLVGPPGLEVNSGPHPVQPKNIAQVESIPSPVAQTWEPYLNQIEEEAQKIRLRQDELVSLSEALETQAKAIDWWHQNLSAHEANLVEQKRVLEEKQREIEQREKLLFETFQVPPEEELSQPILESSPVLPRENAFAEETEERAPASFSGHDPEVVEIPQPTSTFEESAPSVNHHLEEISGNGILSPDIDEVSFSHHALAELESSSAAWPEDDSWDFLSQSAEPTATAEIELPSQEIEVEAAASVPNTDEVSFPPATGEKLLEGSFKEEESSGFPAAAILAEPLNTVDPGPKDQEKEMGGNPRENEEHVISFAPMVQTQETEPLTLTHATLDNEVEEKRVVQTADIQTAALQASPEIASALPVLIPTTLPSLDSLSAQKNWFLPHSFEEWFLGEFLGLEPSSIEKILQASGFDAGQAGTNANPLGILVNQGWLRPQIIHGLNALASSEGKRFSEWVESKHPGFTSWYEAISSQLESWLAPPYLIVEKRSEPGPWGETLKAIHTEDGTKVYLLAKPQIETPDGTDLTAAWQTLIDLDHENIVPYLGTVDFLGKTWGIWQEPHGRILADNTRISPALGIWYRLFLQATLGLRALHQQGLTHGALNGRQFVLQPSGVLTFCHTMDLGKSRDHVGKNEIGSLTSIGLRSQKDLSDLGAIGWQWLSRMFGEHDREDWKKWIPQSLWELLNRIDPQSEVFPKILTSDELANQLDRLGLQIRSNPYSWASFLDRQFPGRQNQNSELRRFSA